MMPAWPSPNSSARLPPAAIGGEAAMSGSINGAAGSSRASKPASTARITAAAVTVFVHDPQHSCDVVVMASRCVSAHPAATLISRPAMLRSGESSAALTLTTAPPTCDVAAAASAAACSTASTALGLLI